jgi:hypothetical protein
MDVKIKKTTLGILSSLSLLLFLSLIGVYPLWAQSSENGISEPEPGSVLSGIVIINGTARDPNFLRFEIAFFQETSPAAEWIVFAQGDQPVMEGTLALWDTTIGGEENPVFPDGRYQLRLRVVRTDYNYGEYYVSGLEISNYSATPTITPTLPSEASTPTLPPGTALAATLQAGAEALPSLTPFPTPSPLATPVNNSFGTEITTEEEEPGGLFGQLSKIDVSRFGSAFGLGARIVVYAFISLGAYLVLRRLIRWLRRQFLTPHHGRK